MSVIVNQLFSTAGNGGRKVVRTSNGDMYAVLLGTNNGSVKLYKSTDNGEQWVLAKDVATGSFSDCAITTNGTDLFVITGHNSLGRVYGFSINTTTLVTTEITIDSNQSFIGNLSLALDPTNGHLHAAWESRNSTYSNSINIRYSKSTNGGSSWSSVEQITTFNVSGRSNSYPSIVVSNGTPILLYSEVVSNNANSIVTRYYNGSSWSTPAAVYNGGSNTQTRSTAVVDNLGVIHAAWENQNNVSYSKSSNNGIDWTTPTTVKNLLRTPSITVDKTGLLFVVGDTTNSLNLSIMKSSNSGISWIEADSVAAKVDVTNKPNPSTLFDYSFVGEFGTKPTFIYTDYINNSVYKEGSYTDNHDPVLTLITTNNKTLYENDTFVIEGTAMDVDLGDTVTVRYQIGNGSVRAIKAFLSNGVAESYSKTLTFQGGALYDGAEVIASGLVDGQAYELKVWATDDKGGTSNVESRNFYVVPNRPPVLTVNPPVISGLINSDKFTVDGTFNDLDGNTATVTYRINGGNSVQVASGVSGNFDFEVSFGQLVVGDNSIIVEVTDSFGAKTNRTIKLKKESVTTDRISGSGTYRIDLPLNKATGVITWVQRDINLDVNVNIAMYDNGEAPTFVAMTKDNTAPIAQAPNLLEDQFSYTGAEKQNVLLQIVLTKTSADASEGIDVVLGVIE